MEIILTVPENFSADRVSINVSAGRCRVEDLRAETMELRVDAGELLAESVNATNFTASVAAGVCSIYNLTATDVRLSVDLGELKINGVSAAYLSTNVSAGSAIVSGKITQRGDFGCDLGKLSVELYGRASNYNIDLSVDLGSIDIDGERYSGSRSQQVFSSSNAIPIDLRCGLGEIRLSFVG